MVEDYTNIPHSTRELKLSVGELDVAANRS
jgi:hypothetical protein